MLAFTSSNPHISIPGSSIKSPGSLLSMVKTENRTKDNSSSSEIEFEIERKFEKLSSGLSEEQSIEENYIDPHSPSSLYQDYLKVLSQYNIQINNLLNTQQASSIILSQIIQELVKLPQNFIRKLQLRITLTNHPDVFNARNFFRSDDSLDGNKIIEKFYRLLFENFIRNFPSLLNLWQEDDNSIEEESRKMSSQIAKIHEMEFAFYAIMQNKKSPKTKLDVNKLKKILIDLDPISFSVEWFKERNLELKKNFRVQFNV